MWDFHAKCVKLGRSGLSDCMEYKEVELEFELLIMID